MFRILKITEKRIPLYFDMCFLWSRNWANKNFFGRLPKRKLSQTGIKSKSFQIPMKLLPGEKMSRRLKIISFFMALFVLSVIILGISLYCTYSENSEFKGKITDEQISNFKQYFVPFSSGKDDCQIIFCNFEKYGVNSWCPLVDLSSSSPDSIWKELVKGTKKKYDEIIDDYYNESTFDSNILFKDQFYQPKQAEYKNWLFSRIGKIFMKSYVSDQIEFNKILTELEKDIKKESFLLLRVSGKNVWFNLFEEFTDNLVFKTEELKSEDAVKIADTIKFLTIFLLKSAEDF